MYSFHGAGEAAFAGVEKRQDSTTSLFSIAFSTNVFICSAAAYSTLLYPGDSHLLLGEKCLPSLLVLL